MTGDAIEVRYRVHFHGDPPIGQVEFAGIGCECLTGYSAAEVMANPQLWIDAIHPDDRDAVLQSTAQLLLSGQSDVRVYRMRARSAAHYRRMQDTVTVAKGADGSVCGYSSIVAELGD